MTLETLRYMRYNNSMKFAVIKTGGKQYIVHKDDEIVVDQLPEKANGEVEFEVLATGDDETGDVNLGMPLLDERVKGKVLEALKGDKIRVARFKAKARYRKVRGFRSRLSRVKIVNL